jgi:hypothetical protein
MPTYIFKRDELPVKLAELEARSEKVLWTETDHTNNRRVKVVTRETVSAPVEVDERPECRLFWGGHGCHLPLGHEEEFHRCLNGRDVCSEFDEANQRWRTYTLGQPNAWHHGRSFR